MKNQVLPNPKLLIKKILTSDLIYVAQLHKASFPKSALTKLGNEPIRRYYNWQLTGPHECYAIGVFDQDGILNGFCFGGSFRGSLSGFLSTNKKFLIRWILTHPWLILNPLVFDRIKVALRLFRGCQNKSQRPITIPQFSQPSYGILSIAVDPSRQGSGIGKMLMDAAEMDAMKKGFTHLHLTVHPMNIQAVKFYEKTGWTKIPLSSVEWSGTMEKLIH